MGIFKPDKNSHLHNLIHDAKRSILNFGSIIEKAPLQIYCSALTFSPKMSEIRKHFGDQVPRWIRSTPMVQEDWNPSLQALECHSNWVLAVAFSQDGQLLASASHDNTVRLWHSNTGGTIKYFMLTGLFTSSLSLLMGRISRQIVGYCSSATPPIPFHNHNPISCHIYVSRRNGWLEDGQHPLASF